jgi:FkbM family methyltransferase
MVLPRSHVLPYYAGPGSLYGRNLVEVGRLIAEAEGSLRLLDIGANVGDTTLHLLDKAPGTAVCVEPDPTWLRYLEMNVGQLANVEIEPAAVVGSESDEGLRIVHEAVGTSRVERSAQRDALLTISTDELLRRHPQLAGVRLVKSDTDGWEVMLMPHLARTFAASRPLLFLEFDPRLTALTTPELDPSQLWPLLAELGYRRAVVWDNGGRLLGGDQTANLELRTTELAGSRRARGYDFWDVAVCHEEDEIGLRILDELSRAT